MSECRPEGARCRAFLIIPNSYGVRELGASQSGCSRLQCEAASTFMRRNDQARGERAPVSYNSPPSIKNSRHHSRQYVSSLDIHVIMDNYGTYKTKLIRDWFAKRPRWRALHIDPGVMIDQAEPFFVLLTESAPKRGEFGSVAELEKAISLTSRPPIPAQSPYAGPRVPTTFSPASDAFASALSPLIRENGFRNRHASVPHPNLRPCPAGGCTSARGR